MELQFLFDYRHACVNTLLDLNALMMCIQNEIANISILSNARCLFGTNAHIQDGLEW